MQKSRLINKKPENREAERVTLLLHVTEKPVTFLGMKETQ